MRFLGVDVASAAKSKLAASAVVVATAEFSAIAIMSVSHALLDVIVATIAFLLPTSGRRRRGSIVLGAGRVVED